MRGGALLLVLLACGLARAERFDAPHASFAVPAGFKADKVVDIATEEAVRLSPTDQAKAKVTGALVLVGQKKIAERDLDAEAASWHTARLKNRTAWGMRSAGGLPRDVATVAGKRVVRYRDKVGSALGEKETTFACVHAGGRMTCVQAEAPADARDQVDRFIAAIISSLTAKRK